MLTGFSKFVTLISKACPLVVLGSISRLIQPFVTQALIFIYPSIHHLYI
jgi:hypothetical protein